MEHILWQFFEGIYLSGISRGSLRTNHVKLTQCLLFSSITNAINNLFCFREKFDKTLTGLSCQNIHADQGSTWSLQNDRSLGKFTIVEILTFSLACSETPSLHAYEIHEKLMIKTKHFLLF